ncbi:hypothetical protein PM082_018321 [Marasmius tenuissimus]|nr:hypothetical protein PM082_018321 [Marasmius tenuissimus]
MFFETEKVVYTVHSLQDPYLHIVKNICYQLCTLQEAGAPISLVTSRGIIVANIAHHNPEIFDKEYKNGTEFRASDSWCRAFLRGTLNWSERRSTQAAQELLKKWEDLCERAFLQCAHIIKEEDIPIQLFVNSDQTGVIYSPGLKLTWAEKGSCQVSVVGADGKQAFTVLISILAGGQVLPLQAVYGGKTTKSCPTKAAPHYDDATAAGFRFVPSGKKNNHWSDQKTMREFVDNILSPYFK